MAETKHTPGPWRVDERQGMAHGQKTGRFVIHPEGFAKMDLAACDTYVGDANSEKEAARLRALQFANARLIAAAPDLLEALRLAIHEVHASAQHQAACATWPHNARTMGHAKCNCRVGTAINVARAAIAKAEGR